MEAPEQALLPGAGSFSSGLAENGGGGGGDSVDSVADAAAVAGSNTEDAALALVQDAELHRCCFCSGPLNQLNWPLTSSLQGHHAGVKAAPSDIVEQLLARQQQLI